MSTATTSYPFDPTGSASTNQITDEVHVLTAVNWGSYHFIVPRWAPFFADSVVLNFKAADGTYKPLVEGKDYYFSHKFISASRACAKDVYGSISFLDPTLSGQLDLQAYNTVGGNWTQDINKIAEILADEAHNPRITSWDSVVDMVVSFPVIDHEWDLVDMVGMSDVVTALNAIETQMRGSSQSGLTDHINNTNNPHKVTAAQVGLDQVRNLPTADQANAVALVSDNYYMTPWSMGKAITAGIGAALSSHTGNTGNPHNTTAAQVGAYTTAQVDSALAAKLGVSAQAADSAKFGGMRPADYAAYVLTGTASNANLFAGMDPTSFKAYLQDGAAADTEKFNGMTYDQVKTDILSGTAASAATFGGYSFSALVNYILGQTATNATHFNGNDYATVKADILSGTAANATQFDGYTFAQAASQILSGKAADSAMFNGMTYAAVKADILSGQITNALKFGGYSVDAYAAYVLQGTASNATLFNGQTATDFTASVLTGTAANALKVGGMSVSDILAQVVSASNANVTTQGASNYSSGESAGTRWLPVGQLYLPLTTSEYSKYGDAQWLITGLDYSNAIDSECHHVRMSGRTATGPGVRVIVTNLGGPRATANQYGYTVASSTDTNGITRQLATLYVKLDANHGETTITQLSAPNSGGQGVVMYNQTPVTVEPAGITYVSNVAGADAVAHQSDVAAVQASLQAEIDALNAAFVSLATSFS